jgi:beta-glucanase (GH16 family)
MGHVNASGQVPDIPNLPSLIDSDTPDEIKNSVRTGFNGRDYQLVFSDEFNTDGRTFYPGDDPFVSHRNIFLRKKGQRLLTFTVRNSGRLSIYTTGKHATWNGMTPQFLTRTMVISISQ